ncbi:MAG: DUF2277 domain-containing protein [Acidobacteriaceae bacterium]|nr:DUF2277 domain-containing protein [Acidobacteriaceae bacterium]
MCRSIKVLRKPGEPATAEELNSAALQFVRKISGFHKPSKANQAAFEQAIREIAASSDRLLKTIMVSSRDASHKSESTFGRPTPAASDQPASN